jgi:exodeoxyribonuclease-3
VIVQLKKSKKPKRQRGIATVKIASFNANGIRARMPLLLEWLQSNRPDVLCIQETKVQDPDFPRQPLEDAGYHCAFKGEKSYNGVALLSLDAPRQVDIGFSQPPGDEGTRLISADIAGIRIVNTYVPQGQDPASEKFQYKLGWFRRLRAWFEENFDPRGLLVWVGDINVAPTADDVYDPEGLAGSTGFHPEEHRALQNLMDWGVVDIYRRHHPDEKKAFTFWDYRIPNAAKRGLGWRIDHVFATAPMAERSTGIWIDKEARLRQRPSDHTFIVAEFDLP